MLHEVAHGKERKIGSNKVWIVCLRYLAARPQVAKTQDHNLATMNSYLPALMVHAVQTLASFLHV